MILTYSTNVPTNVIDTGTIHSISGNKAIKLTVTDMADNTFIGFTDDTGTNGSVKIALPENQGWKMIVGGVEVPEFNVTKGSLVMLTVQQISGVKTVFVTEAARGGGKMSFWKGTQAEYDALGTPHDPNTLYLITG